MTVVYSIFQDHDLINLYSINEETFLKFWKKIQDGYLISNPYHNKSHGADVVWQIYDWLRKTDWNQNNHES